MDDEVPPTDLIDSFHEIKAIFAPYQQILNTLLELTSAERIERVDRVIQPDNPRIPTYVVYRKRDDFAQGRSAFPPGLEYEIQTAIMQHNMCTKFVYAAYPHLHKELKMIGADMHYLQLIAKPEYRIIYDGEPVVQAMHTVINITDALGQEIIADFTVQQFGINGDDWWFRYKAEYLARCTEDGEHWPATLEDMQSLQEHHQGSSFLQSLVQEATAVVAQLDWEAFRLLPDADHRSWVDTQTRDIVNRIRGFKDAGHGAQPDGYLDSILIGG